MQFDYDQVDSEEIIRKLKEVLRYLQEIKSHNEKECPHTPLS